MAFFTLASPFETHAPQVQGSAIILQDKFGNLIVCEPEPISSSSPALPVGSRNILNSPIDTSTLQKYTIYEGSDGNKYLSPNVALGEQLHHPQIHVHDTSNLADIPGDEFDDNEPLQYLLDHMYAKKPKEPGTETKKPVRKRTRKKEDIKTQIIIQEVVQPVPAAPKINIIRQGLPLPLNPPLYKPTTSRPRILNTKKMANWTKSEVVSPATSNTILQPHPNPPPKCRQRKTPTSRNTNKTDPTCSPTVSALFEECDVPALGAYVTIISEDGESLFDIEPSINGTSSYFPNSNSMDLDDINDSYMDSAPSSFHIEEDPLDMGVSHEDDESELYFFDEVEEVVV